MIRCSLRLRIRRTGHYMIRKAIQLTNRHNPSPSRRQILPVIHRLKSLSRAPPTYERVMVPPQSHTGGKAVPLR